MLASKRLRSLGWRRRWLARLLEPRVSPIRAWCDFWAHCPAGQLVGPEKSDWAGLETDAAVAVQSTD